MACEVFMSDNGYLSFELEIGAGKDRDYPLNVVNSPAGNADGLMHFPYDKSELDSFIESIREVLRRSISGRNLQPADDQVTQAQEEPSLQVRGQELFNALFRDDILSIYNQSRGIAEEKGKDLRIILRIKSPEMNLVPWELLYDRQNNSYLCLRDSPIVRYLQVGRPVKSLKVKAPLRILGLISNPKNLAELDVENEKKRVNDALKDLQAKGLVELKWVKGQTWEDLLRELKGTWHVFYYIGHGAFDPDSNSGLIALQTGDGNYMNASQLGTLIADQKKLRLVLLNSCEGALGSELDIFSSTAATLVQSGIPAVLAMQTKVSDRAAIRFAQYLFEGLSMGKPLESAVTDGRKAMYVGASETVEWMIPVLYMRSKDSVLFSLKKPDLNGARPELEKVAGILDSMGFKIDDCVCGQGPMKGKAFFFKGDKFVRYDWEKGQVDPGFPALIKNGFHGMPAGFAEGSDAILEGDGPHAGKAFFFKGDQYVRYDWENDQVDPGYPAPFAKDWNGMPPGFEGRFDAAISGRGPFKGKAYFFKGDQYVRYDWDNGKADPGYPISTTVGWQNMPLGFTGGFDAVINGEGQYSGKAFFFKGDKFVRYDWMNDQVDPDYPKSTFDWQSLFIPPWTGDWDTSLGIMQLRQFGEDIMGRYTQKSGRIQGKVLGNNLSGSWYQAPSYELPQDSGGINLIMAQDKASFIGNWWSSGGAQGRVEGKRI
jgi:hypothetical protein